VAATAAAAATSVSCIREGAGKWESK